MYDIHNLYSSVYLSCLEYTRTNSATRGEDSGGNLYRGHSPSGRLAGPETCGNSWWVHVMCLGH